MVSEQFLLIWRKGRRARRWQTLAYENLIVYALTGASSSSIGYNMIWRVLRNMDSVLNSLINVRTGKRIYKSGSERLMYFLFACKYIFNCASVSQLLQCQRPGTEKSTNRVRILIKVTDACLALTNWRKAWIQFFNRTATPSKLKEVMLLESTIIYMW